MESQLESRLSGNAYTNVMVPDFLSNSGRAVLPNTLMVGI